MATTRARDARIPFEIHEDGPETDDCLRNEQYAMLENEGDDQDQDEEQDRSSVITDESDSVVDESVLEDMERLQDTFKGIKDRFRLINRIGEGTFSTVYKAEDLLYDHFDNTWDIDEKENSKWSTPPLKKRRTGPSKLQELDEYGHPRRRKPKYVAIKKIYVTSSPFRILNELDLLNDLRGADSVCPLITAFRHTDQVVAVLPYFHHTDFRTYFRKMTIPDMQIYFRSLFTALAAVHEQGVLHRDIKPTNFLYEPTKRRGVLVDFGLAERQGTDCRPCLCQESPSERRRRIQNSVAAAAGPSSGYPKNDSRPSRRANRAGTRGFRAPEVLFKCTEQTTKIDIWSAGVILLTILSRRFPFFNSEDDIEAMIEIATIFGTKRMKQAAYLHGASFETNIPTIGTNGFTLSKLVLWSTCRNDERGVNDESYKLSEGERLAVSFLERCLELDPNKRISAVEALQHEFLAEPGMTEDEYEDEMHLV